jgi:hypothetical protein
LADAFKWSWDDTSIVSLSSIIRNTLFFNRNNPRYGLDFGYAKQRSKAFQTNGYESREKIDYTLGSRFALNANWTFTGTYIVGEKRNASEFFSSNDFRYNYQEYKPKVSYQFQQTWRVSIDYNYQQSYNLPELGGEQSEVQQVGLEMRYSFIKIGVITAKYSFFDVQFDGNLNTPLAYDMLQGLSNGNNQLFNLQIQQRIVILIWAILSNILNMPKDKMKQKHLWLDHIDFDWMKLKFIKKNKEEEKNIKLLNCNFFELLLDIEFFHFFK